MRKTLVISFALRNTYRVNGILYSIKQIPLVGRLLPEKLYSVTALKLLANILSVLWEVGSVFLGKLIYFLTMVLGIGLLYENAPAGGAFLHILLFLTAIGGSVGLVLGKLLHWFVMEQINIDMVSFPHTVMPLSYGYSLLLTFLFAFIVNLVMFQKLDKINMAESLKSIE